jgi:hypothetical protein
MKKGRLKSRPSYFGSAGVSPACLLIRNGGRDARRTAGKMPALQLTLLAGFSYFQTIPPRPD